jgi:hypothetical protein
MKTEQYGDVLNYFYSIPDEILCRMVLADWSSIETLCMALTLDLQIIQENYHKQQAS